MGDEEMVPVEVVGVRQHLVDDEIVVLLLDPAAELFVPILIGPTEASAIATAQAGIVTPRPMTHDLLRDVLAAVGVGLTRVEITELTDGVFHAALVLGTGARVDSRASDAIALAVRTGSPVLCSAEVVAVAGVEVSTKPAEAELERFREFLDHVTPDDFEEGDAGGGEPPGGRPGPRSGGGGLP
ncbi:bifunctional nuclease family protein [Cellulomonas sp. ATA003]|uniref:bifunctional nuclease family protein n=1 Tax=Cellulomonas sp. ATA003 TaxID=3073064 RepID=UPI002873253F|nr:bifunctional nuclease family protein [Cellulomonas sp. ATA003]WNB84312.1 bifunctional nuclease family protein [Cellulomonas sp. ATA003]